MLSTISIKNLAFVFLGGGIGCVCRYLINLIPVINNTIFPTGTLLANIIGCFIIGLIFSIGTTLINMPLELRLLLMVGFCGGLTTFSSFALEMITYSSHSKIITLSYLIVSILGCLISTHIGIIAGEIISKNELL